MTTLVGENKELDRAGNGPGTVLTSECAFVRKNGSKCRKLPMGGSRYCWPHSSEEAKEWALEAREAAREQLVHAATRASQTLLDLLDAEDEAVRLRAATAVLDRLGLSPVQHVQMSGTVEHRVGPVEEATDALIERLLERKRQVVEANSTVQ